MNEPNARAWAFDDAQDVLARDGERSPRRIAGDANTNPCASDSASDRRGISRRTQTRIRVHRFANEARIAHSRGAKSLPTSRCLLVESVRGVLRRRLLLDHTPFIMTRRYTKPFITALSLGLFAARPSTSFADNPIVQTLYTADPAAMVHDGILYLYTTHDEDVTINNFFTMNDWRWSALAALGMVGALALRWSHGRRNGNAPHA